MSLAMIGCSLLTHCSELLNICTVTIAARLSVLNAIQWHRPSSASEYNNNNNVSLQTTEYQSRAYHKPTSAELQPTQLRQSLQYYAALPVTGRIARIVPRLSVYLSVRLSV